MAPSISSCRISWYGPPTIPQLTANLFKRQRTVLTLPVSYHLAVSAHLYPTSRVRKSIDLIGEARLLARIAEIEGLEELARRGFVSCNRVNPGLRQMTRPCAGAAGRCIQSRQVRNSAADESVGQRKAALRYAPSTSTSPEMKAFVQQERVPC